MSDFRLSKVQRNELAAIAEAIGLSLGDFTWSEEVVDRFGPFSVLRHEPTNATLRFAPFNSNGLAFRLEWWPNFLGAQTSALFHDWSEVRKHARGWLDAVEKEYKSADMWAAAREQRAWIAEPPAPSANSAFTPVERELLAQHLRTIEAFVVTTFDVTVEQHAEVRAQLKYLTEATERLGRFDWRGLAVSTLIGIVLQLGLTPERANGFMSFAANLLGPFVAGAAQLLPGR